MESEWFDIAYINFDEAILHGRIDEGEDEERVRRERTIRVVLNEDQKRAVEDLNFKHEREMKKLLRGFAT